MKEWIMIVAILLGPILAVQAQKLVEKFQEKRRRKLSLFGKLMATRAARVSPEHVQALNMIDIVFYGEGTMGLPGRTQKEQAVIDAWKEYLDHLNNHVPQEQIDNWRIRGEELFTNLLFEMAKDLGYSFDRVQLKKGAYSPMAHGDLEFEQAALRRSAIRALTGENPIMVNVVPTSSSVDSNAESTANASGGAASENGQS